MAFFGQDAPLCDVLSFDVTITAAVLTPQTGPSVSVLPQGQSVTVDFAQLMDFSTILNLGASIPAGTYTSLTLTFANPQLTVFDTTQSPPAATTLATTLTNSTVTITLSSPLQVTANGVDGLSLDFNLSKSVEVDSNGQVTGTVSPVLTAGPVAPMNDDGREALQDIDDLAGVIQSVSTTSNNPAFSGNFVLSTPNGKTVTVNVTSSTKFDDDDSGLNGLAVNAFVEVDALVDTNGNLVAKEVDFEDTEDSATHKAAFMGLVVSVTRDGLGHATHMTLMVTGEEPDEHQMVPLKSAFAILISNSTRFKIAAEGANEDQLTFDSTTLGVGQLVAVHAAPQSPSSSGQKTAPVASAIVLRLQAIQGNFSTLLSAGDNLAGAFTFTPCSPLFVGNNVDVVTFDDTAFSNVTGLNALTPAPTTVVKGLLFYEPSALQIAGVNLQGPSLVFEAKGVRVLQ